MTEDLEYRPLASSAAVTFGIPAAAGLVLLIHSLIKDGPLWHPSGPFELMAWLMLLVSPCLLLTFGWSYELQRDHLVIKRFGRPRRSLALIGYQGTSMVWFGTMPRLRFIEGSVWLVSNVDATRSAFLDELERRAELAGSEHERAKTRLLDPYRALLVLAELQCPDKCVACGVKTNGVGLSLSAIRRPGSFIVWSMILQVAVPVAACPRHVRLRRLAGPMSSVLVFSALTLSFWLPMSSVAEVDIFGSLLIAVIVALFVQLQILPPWLGRLLDWRLLGLYVERGDLDLRTVVVKAREPSLLAAIVERSGGSL